MSPIGPKPPQSHSFSVRDALCLSKKDAWYKTALKVVTLFPLLITALVALYTGLRSLKNWVFSHPPKEKAEKVAGKVVQIAEAKKLQKIEKAVQKQLKDPAWRALPLIPEFSEEAPLRDHPPCTLLEEIEQRTTLLQDQYGALSEDFLRSHYEGAFLRPHRRLVSPRVLQNEQALHPDALKKMGITIFVKLEGRPVERVEHLKEADIVLVRHGNIMSQEEMKKEGLTLQTPLELIQSEIRFQVEKDLERSKEKNNGFMINGIKMTSFDEISAMLTPHFPDEAMRRQVLGLFCQAIFSNGHITEQFPPPGIEEEAYVVNTSPSLTANFTLNEQEKYVDFSLVCGLRFSEDGTIVGNIQHNFFYNFITMEGSQEFSYTPSGSSRDGA